MRKKHDLCFPVYCCALADHSHAVTGGGGAVVPEVRKGLGVSYHLHGTFYIREILFVRFFAGRRMCVCFIGAGVTDTPLSPTAGGGGEGLKEPYRLGDPQV